MERMEPLTVYNTLSRKKEVFEPQAPPHVGLYVCGPTVYGDAHLGHARPYITFGVLHRWLTAKGYKVRYVRNITDVGHLVGDADEGEDKIQKKARLEQLEPMEVVQHYTNGFHRNMDMLNTVLPSIEPRASGHIIEQIQMIEDILKNGYAYEVNGSVYFDVERYNADHNYGKLSGRKVEDLQSDENRNLSLVNQEEKRSSLDFALWKKAAPEHLMHWPSPWSVGFPGWHLECSAMSTKYLGEPFDIHGGGMDLLFPHHECEIAQSVGAHGKEPVRYWMHNNMITINGKKMGKSLGNFITLDELFTGSHNILEQAYSPMTVRFFILQAHYRSTLDFSNEALQAAEKGYKRLMAALKTAESLTAGNSSSSDIAGVFAKCAEAMNDDMNTPITIANLFEAVRIINSVKDGKESISADDLALLQQQLQHYVHEVLGLRDETTGDNSGLVDGLMDTILDLRSEARSNKDWGTSDMIRDRLNALKIVVKDGKEGASWTYDG